MPRTKTEPQLEPRELAELRSHPSQALYFDDLTDHDLRALAADIRANGLKNPIEVMPPKNKVGLPADTIIKGHQRRRALALNGEIKTVVLVRYDLTTSTAEEVERQLIGDNLARRQLDPLGKARAVLRMFEIERGSPRGKLRSWDEPEARDRVGRAIGMSGRNLSRYFAVLRTPVTVQNAFRAGRLPLVVAARVAGLTSKVQTEIAERIGAGERPTDVVGDYLPAGDGRHATAKNALAAFVRTLKRSLADLEDRRHELSSRRVARYVPELKKARVFIRRLIDLAAGQGDGVAENGSAD